MTSHACWIFYWIALPISLIVSFLVRYNALAAVHLVFFLCMPFSPKFKTGGVRKCKVYAGVISLTSAIFTFGHLIFQILLASDVIDFSSCNSIVEKVCYYVGFQSFKEVAVADILRLLLPDPAVFFVSFCTFLLLNRCGRAPSSDENEEINEINTVTEKEYVIEKLINGLIMCTTMVVMLISGITYPNVISLIYLLGFIVVMTMWSFHQPILTNGIVIFRGLLCLLTTYHLLSVYLYQIEYFQNLIQPQNIGTRLLGLQPLILTQWCNGTETDNATVYHQLILNTEIGWPSFASFFIVLVLHWLLACGICRYVRVFSPLINRNSEASQGGNLVNTLSTSFDFLSIVPKNAKNVERRPLVVDEQNVPNYNSADDGIPAECSTSDTRNDQSEATSKEQKLMLFSMWLKEAKTWSYYVVALICMLLWSVTYHSYLSLILLMWSCFLWISTNTGRNTLYCSPAFTIFGIALFLLSYIYALPLTSNELPEVVNSSHGPINLTLFGMKRYEPYPCGPLAVQMLYLCGFWLVLHQFYYLKKSDARNAISSVINDENKTTWTKKLLDVLFKVLSNYFIVFVYAFHLAISTEGYPSGLKIGYMLFLLMNLVLTFLFSIKLWRKTLSTYWTVLVAYSMFVLLLLYCFQFPPLSDIIIKMTNFTKTQLQDLGLVIYTKPSELLLNMMLPGIFFLITVIHLKYFNKEFLSSTAVPNDSLVESSLIEDDTTESANNVETSEETIELTELNPTNKSKIESCLNTGRIYTTKFLSVIADIILKILDFHLWKFVFITVFVCAANDMSALYSIIVLVWSVLVNFSAAQPFLYVLTGIYISVILLSYMFYQLDFVECNNTALSTPGPMSCNNDTCQGILDYVGLHKMSHDDSFFYISQGYISILIMIVFHVTFKRYRAYNRLVSGDPKPVATTLFPEITIKNRDAGILQMIKYMCNFFFYKFGVETTLVLILVSISVHDDIYGVFYAITLALFSVVERRSYLKQCYRFYACILVILVVFQSLLHVGVPPSSPVSYPWIGFGSELLVWLNLPNPCLLDNEDLIADFFQFLVVLCQLHVFTLESKADIQQVGGSNTVLLSEELEQCSPESNATNNFFIASPKSLLDRLKILIFKYFVWVTIAVVFLTGAGGQSLYCLGYIVWFMYVLPNLYDVLAGKHHDLMKIWNVLVYYNIGVILVKTLLQLVSCVYIQNCPVENPNCYDSKALEVTTQLFNLACNDPQKYGYDDSSSIGAKVGWDFTCFVFIILQRRIFRSRYFMVARDEMKTSFKFSSRGAELWEERAHREAKEFHQQQEETLIRIKQSMKSIKERYLTWKKGIKPSKNHVDAVRSGEYYMFDDVEYPAKITSKKKTNPDQLSQPLDLIHSAVIVGVPKTMKKKKRLSSEAEQANPLRKVCIGDELTVIDDLPSTSKTNDDQIEVTGEYDDVPDVFVFDKTDQDAKPVEDSTEEDEPVPWYTSIYNGFLFLWEILMMSVDYVILLLNKSNRNYRNIVYQLDFEKSKLQNVSTNTTLETEAVLITISNEKGEEQPVDFEEVPASEFDKSYSRFIRLCYALWYTAISRTEGVCYFMIILNLIIKTSLLALVLPLSIFLWASFYSPRPPRTFWTFAMKYIMLVIVVKYIFQFDFFPWNQTSVQNAQFDNPYWWPRFIGIEQNKSWMVMELLQLLTVVFHISSLKDFGLWDPISPDDSMVADDCSSTSTDTNMLDTSNAEPSTSECILKKDITNENGSPGDSLHSSASSSSQDEHVEEASRLEEKPSKISNITIIYESVIAPYSSIFGREYTMPEDVYLPMLLCDFINCIITIFGSWAFGPYGGDILVSIQSNKVPTGFLIFLLVQFSLILVDRGLYLRKNMLGKIVFHFFIVIAVHVYFFFVLPGITQKSFFDNSVAQTWYFFKCLYFLLSAYQIKKGYPQIRNENFLTKSYGVTNLVLFIGYRMIPFAAELTAVMNWMFSDTSMTMSEWMKLWSIHAEIFELKCWREYENNYPVPRGEAKAKWIKYLMGGGFVLVLVFIIWFPLILMNTVLSVGGVVSNPVSVSIGLTLGSYDSLFEINSGSQTIQQFEKDQYNGMKSKFSKNLEAFSFLTQFQYQQVVSVNIKGASKTVWSITPPQFSSLEYDLSSSNSASIDLMVKWEVEKDGSKSAVQSSVGSNMIVLNQTDQTRSKLHSLLKGDVQNVTIENFIPAYLYAPTMSSTATVVTALKGVTSLYTNVSLMLERDSKNNITYMSWWQVSSEDRTKNPGFNITIFSDKESPSSLNFLVSYGVIGLYVSVVLVISRLVRTMFQGASAQVMFLELPNVDRILQLCNEIFIVREAHEYELEEDLYARLLFLYRSPSTLIKWTKKLD